VTKKDTSDTPDTPKLSPEQMFGCVCADCGHEQPTMDPCAKCGSVRVVLVKVIRELFGEDWRSNFATAEEL